GDEVRVWVAGCSTGEEAYSVSIILRESLEELGMSSKEIKIFATDLNEKSLSIASTGYFHKKFSENISKERQRRFLKREGDQFQVIDSIKKDISFVNHDIINHAPFFNLDIVVCRNVMIYFNKKQQNETVTNFYESLKENGILFCGENELDLTIDIKRWKQFKFGVSIFEKLELGKEGKQGKQGKQEGLYNKSEKLYSRNITDPFDLKRRDGLSLTSRYIDLLLQGTLKNGVFLKENFDIIYVIGGVEKYFSLNSGYFSKNIFDFLNNEIKAQCRILLEDCAEKEGTSVYELKSAGLIIKAHFLKNLDDLKGFYLQFDSLSSDNQKEENVSDINKDELDVLKKSLKKKEKENFYLKEQFEELGDLAKSLSDNLEKETAYYKNSNAFYESLRTENQFLKEQVNVLNSMEASGKEAFLYLNEEGILKDFNEKTKDYFPLESSDKGLSLDRVSSCFKSFSSKNLLKEVKQNKDFKGLKLTSKEGNESLLQIISISPNLYLFKITELP
ncbi:MAG: CheR family methyltransferase, partial [Bdellovibrionota bacterium]|nr:CheR family methyltransferase [Bdellovibrionota bacterium]